VKAHAAFPSPRAEYAKGETRYYDQAQQQIKTLTTRGSGRRAQRFSAGFEIHTTDLANNRADRLHFDAHRSDLVTCASQKKIQTAAPGAAITPEPPRV